MYTYTSNLANIITQQMLAINVKAESCIHEFNGRVSDFREHSQCKPTTQPSTSERLVSDRLRRQQYLSKHREQIRQSRCNARPRARQQQSEEERQQRLLAQRECERSVRQHESEERQQQRLLARRERERSAVQQE